MIDHLDVPEGKSAEAVRKEFDNELGVAMWGTPGAPMKAESSDRDPDAPSWWTDEEDASQGFLAAMGVTFPNG